MKRIITIVIFLCGSQVYAQEKAQEAFSSGVKLLQEKKFVEAESQFRIALDEGKVKDGLKMSYIYLAKTLNGQRKYEQAILYFTKSIEIDSLDPATFTDRGLSYAYNGDNENAIQDFYHVLKLDSIGSQAQAAYYWLGRIASSEMDNEKAIEFYTKLLNLAPSDAEGYFLRGTAKSNLMDSQGAIADFDLAIKFNPNYMEAYANRGVSKVNLVPVSEKLDKKLKCLEDPCSDLLKAKELGDNTVNDMIFLYCKKCK